MSNVQGSYNSNYGNIKTNDVDIGSLSLTESSLTKTSLADGDDLTVSVAGTTDSSLVLESSGTGADAVKITASNAAGGVEITSGTSGVTIDSALVGEDQTVVTGTLVPTAAQSGSVFKMDCTAAVTVNLPTVTATNIGSEYKFVVTTDNANLVINTTTDDNSFTGCVASDTGAGTTDLIAAAADDDVCTLTAPALGSSISVKAISVTEPNWFIEGMVLGGVAFT